MADQNTGVQRVLDRLGTAAGASVSADIAAVQSAVDTVDDFVDTEITAIKNAVGTPVRTTGTHSQTAAGGTTDQTVIAETTVTTEEDVILELDTNALAQNAVLKIQVKTDGATFRNVEPTKTITVGSTEKAVRVTITAVSNYRIVLASASAEAADRSVPYVLLRRAKSA